MNRTLEKDDSIKNGVGRMAFSLIFIALEILFIILLLTRLNRYAMWINIVTRTIALLIVLFIYNKPGTSSMAECTEVTEKYTVGRGRFLKFKQLLLRLAAPLV